MPYLIDSDIVIDHLADVATATALLEQLSSEGIAVSIITYMEAYQGVLRSPHQSSARKHFEAFLATVPVLPFSQACAKRCAQLREMLHKEGKRVKARALDLMTAAIALEYGLTVVTRNVEDYQDITDLKLRKTA
jgi:predicted nucleic acid-binding protein